MEVEFKIKLSRNEYIEELTELLDKWLEEEKLNKNKRKRC